MTVSRPSRWFVWSVLIALLVAIPALTVRERPELLKSVISARFPEVRWVDPTTLASWMERPEPDRPVLLDARRADEFAVSHLQGARRIDPDSSTNESLGVDSGRRIIMHCSVGYRSGAVVEQLEVAGYSEVYNLEGGS